jgi:hypothetical protein
MPEDKALFAFTNSVTKNETHIASAGSKNDGVALTRAADGSGAAVLVFPKIPLLKGEYYINVYLACEQALHVYDHFQHAEKLYVTQSGLERGFVSLDILILNVLCEDCNARLPSDCVSVQHSTFVILELFGGPVSVVF